MKHTLTFIFLSLLLTGCGRRDAKIQQELVGTWIGSADDIRVARTVSPSGHLDFEMADLTNGRVRVRQEGTMLVKNGDLVITITNDSRTGPSLVSYSSHGRIVSMNTSELVVSWGGEGAKEVLKKAKP